MKKMKMKRKKKMILKMLMKVNYKNKLQKITLL